MHTLDQIHRLAQQQGLLVRGGFAVDDADNVPPVAKGVATVTLVLFGNAGSSLWECFSSSKEYADALPDPLNRWSKRIGEDIANQLCGRALFPFGEPPYQPFIDWAKKAESLHCSKIGMLIHPRYGLWHAYRFAIALPTHISGLAADESAANLADDFIAGDMIEQDICQRCVEQPCLSACPVGAFTQSGYDVAVCYDFLKRDSGTQPGGCRKGGCQSRVACPQGHRFRYQAEHSRFHMDAFFATISNRL